MLPFADFKEEITNRLVEDTKNNKEIEITIFEDNIHIKKKDGSTFNLWFNSMYERHQQGESIEHLYHMMVEPITDINSEFSIEPTWEEVQNRIFPQFKSNQLMSGLVDYIIYEESPIPTVNITYVIDSDRGLMFISDRMLKEWGVTEKEVKERALQNLNTLSKKSKLKLHKEGEFKFYLSMTNDAYDAVRILTANYKQIKETLKGKIFVGIPNRDCLIIFSDKNPYYKNIIRQNQVQFQNNRYRITPFTYEWNGKEFKPLLIV